MTQCRGSSRNRPACGEDGRPPPRAQSGARTAPAQDARKRARARTQDTRAKRVPPPGGRDRRRGGRKGAERNATEERYAETEPQSFGDGMANMTLHDTMQRVFHEPPRPPFAASAKGGIPGSRCCRQNTVWTLLSRGQAVGGMQRQANENGRVNPAGLGEPVGVHPGHSVAGSRQRAWGWATTNRASSPKKAKLRASATR